MMDAELDAALSHRDADWGSLRAVVTGAGTSGVPAALALAKAGAQVVVVDQRTEEQLTDAAKSLAEYDISLSTGVEATEQLPTVAGADCDVVITSPGWNPRQPILAQAADAGIPVWGEVELAWRMRRRDNPAPWLNLTGTNGKTTTVKMTAAVLQAGGYRAAAAGNVGTPLIDAVLAEDPYDVIAVELSSFQLYWSASLRPLASACLNIAPDHIDWHEGLDNYTAAKGLVYRNTEKACLYNVNDPVTEQLVRDADVVDGCRAIGFTLGVPQPGMLGVVDEVLCDRAFGSQRATSAAELASLEDVRTAGGGTLAPHLVANALAAAGLARAFGLEPTAVRDGLRGFRPDAHRIATVASRDGITWIDDSKATNAHAADASLRAFDSVVWIAGGLAKGASFDDLVATHAQRIKAAVVLGKDRSAMLQALTRHAPQSVVVEVDIPDTDGVAVMDEVVAQCARLARSGDTVLLAPACASMDQFISYGHRGTLFAQAVQRHLGSRALGSDTSEG